MLVAKAARYFDEVARRGSLRRAADVLHIAPSAIDRQILQLEEELGTRLFDRTPNGMRLSAAGELLADGVRRWQRDALLIRSNIDSLIGLRRGKVTIGLVEGATDLVSDAIASFHELYPAIEYRLEVYGSQRVLDQLLERFPHELNRRGFPFGARCDSRYLLAKEAGMDGSIAFAGSSGQGNCRD